MAQILVIRLRKVILPFVCTLSEPHQRGINVDFWVALFNKLDLLQIGNQSSLVVNIDKLGVGICHEETAFLGLVLENLVDPEVTAQINGSLSGWHQQLHFIVGGAPCANLLLLLLVPPLNGFDQRLLILEGLLLISPFFSFSNT